MNKKLGRKSVVTNSVVRKLETAFKSGLNVSEACIYSGISRDTYYAHLSNDKDFSDKMNDATAWVLMTAKKNIANRIFDGDIKASIWLLEKGQNPLSTGQASAESIENNPNTKEIALGTKRIDSITGEVFYEVEVSKVEQIINDHKKLLDRRERMNSKMREQNSNIV